MAKNKALQALAEQVRDERQLYANTATRVGNVLLALLDYIEHAPYLHSDSENEVQYLMTLLKGCIIGESANTILNPDGSIICKTIHVNGSAVFDELVFNHQNVLEGDTYFSDRAIVDHIERHDLSHYTLYLRKMFDADEFTFSVGDIVRWSINNLLSKGTYNNGYARVDAVSADTMDVTMYNDIDCPGGVNCEPEDGCRLVRHGHVSDPMRQSTFYISSSTGCFMFLQGVDKPILEDSANGTNYAAWIGLPPNTHMANELLAKGVITPDQPWLYFRGIIVQDLIQVDYKGVPRYTSREWEWNATQQFMHGYDTVEKGYFTDYVWYKGLLWKAAVEKPTIGVAPRFNNTDWICVRGKEDIKIDLISSMGDAFRAGTAWETTLVATVWHGEMQLEESEIGMTNISWTRDWDKGAGDDAWNMLHGKGKCGLQLPIKSVDDLPGEWKHDSSVRFRIDINIPEYGTFSSEYSIII